MKSAKKRLQEWVDDQVTNHGLVDIKFCGNLKFVGMSKEDFINEHLRLSGDQGEEVCQSILNMIEAEERGECTRIASSI